MTSPPPWFEQLVTVLPTLPDSPFTRFAAPADGSARLSAVLVLFGPPEVTGGSSSSSSDLLLTERSTQLRAHAGQVAFPGGRLDPGDSGPEAAAVREAVEETGLDPDGVRVRATGPDLYVPITNFLVTPVVGWWERPSPVAPVDEAEVARVIRVPLDELLDPGNRFQTVHPSGFVSPGFEVGGLFVWGFTGGVLDWLISLSGLERPWDREFTREVPGRFLSDRPLARELTEQLDEVADGRVAE